MSYSSSLAHHRAELNKMLTARDAVGTRACLIALEKLLDEMAVSDGLSIMESMRLRVAAGRYADYAALVRKLGLTPEVVKTITEGSAPSGANAAQKPAPKPPVNPSNPFRIFAQRVQTSVVTEKAPDVAEPPRAAVSPRPMTEYASDDWEADVFERNLPAAVRVITGHGQGTGFFICADGLLVTNHHVICHGELEGSIRIKSGDNRICCRVRYIDSDEEHDVALLKADLRGESTPFIRLIADYSRLRQADKILLIGNALGNGLAPVSGIVKHTHDDYRNNLVYTAPSNHGDSGSPVLNRRGECVGIHKSSTVKDDDNAVRGYSNATPADTLQKLIFRWRKKHNL